jgi:hypothetical protein
MKTEIVLLIIAFQVVRSILARRKAKKAAEASRNPPAPQAGGMPEAARAPAEAKAKPAEPPRDLLSELAKQLGLELPGQERKPAPAPQPRPVARPQSPQPKPAAPAGTQISRPASQQTSLDRHAESAKRMVKAHPARPKGLDLDETETHRAIGSTPVTEEPEVRSIASLARENLADIESIRRAFILKTIFDKPLSMQPRRPGEI